MDSGDLEAASERMRCGTCQFSISEREAPEQYLNWQPSEFNTEEFKILVASIASLCSFAVLKPFNECDYASATDWLDHAVRTIRDEVTTG